MNNIPLAERLRPKSLDGYIGQEHLIGKDKPLRKNIESGILPSLIFWGPPGVGKTTLAKIIVNSLNKPFYSLSAVHSGVKDVREAIEKAKSGGLFSTNSPVLFIDEIHRFSKSQQDSLLNAVEQGVVTLIGATTENPSFEVNSALLSRCQVYVLESLSKKELQQLLQNAITNDAILKTKKIELKETDALIASSGGDGRKLLCNLELLVNSNSSKNIVVTNDWVQQNIKKTLQYDKKGENHYDIISAYIKSIRGSDPNAAIYWLARMIEGGEDPKFIARRLLILASEDIGNANPTALVMANNCFQAINVIGYPECSLTLSQTTIYLACSAKSNASYQAIKQAQQLVKQTGDLPVPLHLRNAPTKLMKELGYGENYQYAHSYEGNFVATEFLPEDITNTKFYTPGNNPREELLKNYLKSNWKEKYDY